MEDETYGNPDAEEQEIVESELIEPEEQQTVEEDVDIRYLNQKKRAEKAEAELKAMKELLKGSTKQSVKSKETQKPITSDRDETFVISALGSRGLSFEEINTYLEKAKKIAAVEEIPLSQALDTDIFKSFDKTYQEEKRRELASLGGSKGSGGSVTKKSLQTPGLSDEEYKDMLRKQVIG